MQPRPPQLLLAHGLEAYEAGRWDQAAALLGEFVERYERHPRCKKMLPVLGSAQVRAGRPDDAAATLARALEDDPGNADLLELLGHALRLGGRRGEAVEAYRRCLAAGPDDPMGTKAALAEVHLRLGQLDEADAIMREADSAGVSHPRLDLVRGLISLRTGEGRADAIARLEAHRAEEGLADDLCPALFSALGDLLDAEGRYGEAWASYEAANECPADAFRPEVYESQMSDIIGAWTPELVRKLQRWGDASVRPVLIVGTPRSGTTMTELLIARHPGVARGGELRTLSDIVHAMPGRVGGPLHKRAGALGEGDLRRASGEYLAALEAISPDAARVTDKMPMNLLQLGLFAAMFPNGHVVHCRRDPRDACLSCYFRFFFQEHPWSKRLDWVAAFYRQYVRLMDHWRAVLGEVGSPRMLEIRYEDAVADPDGWTRRLGEFVGVGGAAVAPARQSAADAPTLRADQVGKGIYTSSAGKHERYAAHLGVLYGALGDLVEAYERRDGEE